MIKGSLRYTKKFDRITARLEEQVLAGTGRGTRKTAEEIRKYIRSRWSSHPSRAGNPPAKQAGTLDEGIKVENQGRDLLGRFRGKNAKVHFIIFDTSDAGRGQYALAVEDGNRDIHAPRPFLEPAMEKFTDEYADILKGELRKEFRGGAR